MGVILSPRPGDHWHLALHDDGVHLATFDGGMCGHTVPDGQAQVEISPAQLPELLATLDRGLSHDHMRQHDPVLDDDPGWEVTWDRGADLVTIAGPVTLFGEPTPAPGPLTVVGLPYPGLRVLRDLLAYVSTRPVDAIRPEDLDKAGT